MPRQLEKRGECVRILVVTNLYPDARQPGFGTFIAARVTALRRTGASVQVAAIRGVAVHRNIGRKYLRLFGSAMWLAIKSLLRRRPPHIVEAHIAFPTGLLAWPVARLCRAKLVLFFHGGDLREVASRSRWHVRAARFLFARADLLVANSAFTRSGAIGGYGVDPDRIVIWSPGIDTELFRPLEQVRRNPREVLFVGRLNEEKGADILIDAVSKLSDLGATLRIVGDGPARQALEGAAAQRGVTVRFDGARTPTEVARAMAAAGVLAVPSVYQEPLGLVALEGMAAGAMVVASATGGLSESVNPGTNGWLVPPGDASRLAEAIREAIAVAEAPDAPGSVEIREAALHRAAEHDVYAVAERSVAAYRELLDAGRS